MITTKGKTDNSDFPPERLLGELLELVDGLTEELRDLQDEVTALRRKESPEGPDALLTREEAADRLGISTRTLGDMADSGELQPVRIRGRVLYDPETLDAYIQRRAGGADK
jgi:excisionase family DNA binding protein